MKCIAKGAVRLCFSLAGALAAFPAPAAIVGQGPAGGAAESYKLPISAPRDQGDTDLCWVFATLSMLETNYRVRHPGSHVEFSRGALQRLAIADRLRRFASDASTHLDDSGLAVEALALIRAQGLLASADYRDIFDSDPLYPSLRRRLAAGAKADALIAAALGPIPTLTHLDGAPLTPSAMEKAVLGDENFVEYDVAADGRERVGPSSDPDARPETRVHYAPLAKLTGLIHESLRRGEAVVWGTRDHALLIFGADYDAEGTPLAYWIKDSFAPYVYREAASEVNRVMTDVTVSDPPAATAKE